MKDLMKSYPPSDLSDTELAAEVKRLAGCEREMTAALISHLAEFDARRLYLGAGFSSLFTYCTDVLRLSEHEAYNRIVAARVGRRFPIVRAMLGEGSLNLTSVRLLGPHLTGDNHRALLAAASGKSKREVEELIARHFPQPDVPCSVRKLPAAKPIEMPPCALASGGAATVSSGTANEANGIQAVPSSSVAVAPEAVRAVQAPTARFPLVRPLAPNRYEIKFTASAATCEKLRRAQDQLRHRIPNGDVAEIVDRALTALLEDLARKKFAATDRPRASRARSGHWRYVPAAVKRPVWLRDGGRCAFVGQNGRRCAERGFLEFHHVNPHGEPMVDNIQVRCRAHNAHEADLYYGQRDPAGDSFRNESPATSHAVRGSLTSPT
jgi:hypothetical protein